MDSAVFLALLYGKWSPAKHVDAGTPFPFSSSPVDLPCCSHCFRVDEQRPCILESKHARKTDRLPPSHALKHASDTAHLR